MNKETEPVATASVHGRVFNTTQWHLILAAKNGDSAEAQAALEELCRIYWPAIYNYLRRTGRSVEDAQDLTQEFLSRFVHREWLSHLEDQRAKFRSYLLTFLKHLLSDDRRRNNAQKRGGGKIIISLDAYEAEERDALAPADGLSPDQMFDRRWAETVMNRAAMQLREDYASRGKLALFEQLKDLQAGDRNGRSYAEVAAILGMTTQAVKNAMLMYRRRYMKFMHDEVAQTVDDRRDVSGELEYLIELFRR